jgi:hypothetical protein
LLATVPPEVASVLTRPLPCIAVCFEVTTDEARVVAAALEIASPDARFESGRFRTSDDREYVMAFVPYLPHGAAVLCCGG